LTVDSGSAPPDADWSARLKRVDFRALLSYDYLVPRRHMSRRLSCVGHQVAPVVAADGPRGL